MMKQLRIFSLIVLSIILFAGAASAQVHNIPVAPYDTIKALPWSDTKIAAKWDSIGYPNGWNAFSVDVDIMKIIALDPNALTFAIPSTWTQKEGTATASTQTHMVQAMMLPLVQVPAGITKLKLSLDLTATLKASVLYVGVLEKGENRFNTVEFINSMTEVFLGAPISIQATNAPAVTHGECELNMADYTSRELNIALIAVNIDLLKTQPDTYGISNVKLVDADNPTSVIETEASVPYAVGVDGGVTIHNVAPGAQVEVYPLTGSTAAKTVATSSVVNCSLEQGIYVVKVINGNKLTTHKVAVK